MAMGWHVLSQRQQDNLTPQGTFEPVWIITYMVDPENVTGTLTVPDRFYSADYVADEIDKAVTVIKQVHAL